MTAASMRTEGLQRISAGFALFCRAMIEAARGLYWILSGLVLFLAGLLWAPFAWIGLPFAGLFSKAQAFASSWRSLRFPRLHFPYVRFPRVSVQGIHRLLEAVVTRGRGIFVAVLFAAAITAAIAGIEFVLREALPDIGGIVLPLTLFGGVTVAVLIAVVAIRLAARLSASLARFLTQEGTRLLATVVVVILAGAVGAILYAVLRPPWIIALVSCLALVAGLAGFAFVSFGPTGLSMFRFGGRAAAAGAANAEAILTPAPSSPNRRPQPALTQLRPAVSDYTEGAASDAVGFAGRPAMEVHSRSRRTGADRARGRRARSWPAFPQRWITVALLVALALLLAWFGGELLVRAFSGSSQPAVSAAKPAAPSSPSSVGTSRQTVGPEVIQLLADGVPAEVSWRLGYRHLTARLDDGGPVQELALPNTACRAGAVLVFGAASSDGAAARNEALARRRAAWLGDWTRKQLSQCSVQAPAVIVVSLGQARPGLPQPAQRAVRLLALRDEDLGELGTGDDRYKLEGTARAAFKDLDEFVTFEACTLSAPRGELLQQGLPSPCNEREP